MDSGWNLTPKIFATSCMNSTEKDSEKALKWPVQFLLNYSHLQTMIVETTGHCLPHLFDVVCPIIPLVMQSRPRSKLGGTLGKFNTSLRRS